MPLGWIAGAAVVGAGISAAGSIIGSGEQAGAAENAQNISQNEFNTIQRQNQPFINSGYDALSQLNYLTGLGSDPTVAGSSSNVANAGSWDKPGGASAPGGFGSLLTPFTTDNWQQLSPAYNFQKQQGAQVVQNADAAGLWAMSGSALKDLTDYNQSAANTSFNSAFNQYQTQQGNIFNRLSGIAQLGQASANQTGQQGTALAGQAAQSATNVGSAIGGGIVGAGNSLSGAVTGASPWLAYGGGGSGGGIPDLVPGSTDAGATQGTFLDLPG